MTNPDRLHRRPLAEVAFRIAAFRRVDPHDLDRSWGAIAGLVLVSLLPPLAFAFAEIGAEGHFSFRQLPAVLFHVPVILIASIVLATLAGRRDDVPRLMAGALLAWTLIDLLSLGLWTALGDTLERHRTASMAFYYGPIAWLTLAMARLAASLGPVSPPRIAWALLAAALFLALPLGGVYRERSLWAVDYERQARENRGDREAMMAPATEASYYRQPELLGEALSAIEPGRAGIVDVYFVGVAGYGPQDVFMREVHAVAGIFRERFDAGGRIVTLVNNPKTALTHPVASATSLEAALARVGQAMDPEEDVLVLFLTSHGSSEHEFNVQLWPLQLRQITPAMLRGMLDASGIRNRVVIVSACYAGGFVGPLRGEHTLVITAAAPDRNSFGCSNEADWTYFGKAYFDEALRRTTSFTEAFAIARPLIEARERAEDHVPSLPQMSIGKGIEARLKALQEQR
jgi:hypothetical protein